MKAQMDTARATLNRLLDESELTSGMCVRVHGDHLLLGRDEVSSSGDKAETVESVRLTRLTGSSYGLSVRRHTGRWERTPFRGSMKEMVDVMRSYMQHLIAPW
jgi:citrate lyase beta subunit